MKRFGRTERAVHWVHALAFFSLLVSGAILYLPVLSEAVARRQFVKGSHLVTAVVWFLALVVIVALGDRHSLKRTMRDVDRFDRDDRRWLRGRRARQGRFNAGQKLNAIMTAAFAVLFTVSGLLLWLGERDTRFRLDGTIAVHDAVSLVSLVLVCGHLYLSLIHPATRHALRGMTVGDVRVDWAEERHAKWVEAERAAGRI